MDYEPARRGFRPVARYLCGYNPTTGICAFANCCNGHRQSSLDRGHFQGDSESKIFGTFLLTNQALSTLAEQHRGTARLVVRHSV